MRGVSSSELGTNGFVGVPIDGDATIGHFGFGVRMALALQVGACGLLLGVTMPVYISYGQQLLPHGQRVASSITMGVSWGIAGAIVATATWAFKSAGSLSSIFYFFAAASLASSFLCHLLPTPEQSNRAGD